MRLEAYLRGKAAAESLVFVLRVGHVIKAPLEDALGQSAQG